MLRYAMQKSKGGKPTKRYAKKKVPGFENKSHK